MHSKTLFGITLMTLLTVGAGCTKTPSPITQNQAPGLTAEQVFTQKPATDNSSTPPPDTPTNSSVTQTTMEFSTSKHYTAILHTTKGNIEIALNFNKTPNTVKNFVDLARKNFYNKTIFHRVINGFMIQGGDPRGDGTGDPGYKFNDEPFTGEYTRGTVAMANSGPNTNGSQFFIMHADNPLPKNYTIFGHVVKGLEIVDAIATDKVEMNVLGELSTPINPTIVTSVDILEK